MPKRTDVPYLFCQKNILRTARPEESDAAVEVAGWFIRSALGRKNNDEYCVTNPQTKQKLIDILNGMDEPTKTLDLCKIAKYWIKPSLKLSLEFFDDFDYVSDYELFSCIINDLHLYDLSGYKFCFNFQEVFCTVNNQNIPQHYRPGIDFKTDCYFKQRQQMDKFSYQLGKTLLFALSSGYKQQETLTTVTPLVLDHYLKRRALYSSESLETYLNKPLNDFEYFSHIFEAQLFYNNKINVYPHNILAFAPSVSHVDVLRFFIHFHTQRQYPIHNIMEFIFLFQGDVYQSLSDRNQVRQDILRLIKEIKSKILFHVILLTQENITYSLTELAPAINTETKGFSPLAHDAGYYLSDAHVFSTVFRNIQTPDRSNDPYRLSRFLQNQPSRKPIEMPSRQPTSYIISQEMHADYRASKKLSTIELKKRMGLSHTQQVNQAQVVNQAQTLNQQQELSQQQTISQQQTLMQQQQQQLSQTQQASNLWLSSYDFDTFCTELLSHAEKYLAQPLSSCLEKRDYLSIYHKQTQHDLFSQIATNEQFRVRLVAKIFGHICSVKLGKMCYTPVPNHSVDAIISTLAVSMIHQIENCLDGFNWDDDSLYTVSENIITGSRILTFLNQSNLNGEHVAYFGLNNRSIWGARNHNEQFLSKFNERHLSSLSGGLSPARDWQGHLKYYVLLTDESLESLSSDARAAQVRRAEHLLSVFNTDVLFILDEILVLESELIELIQFYFQYTPEYSRVLKKFLSRFEEHTTDNIKLLLDPIISGHSEKMDYFLKVLLALESRDLLDNFYVIYFKYSHTIMLEQSFFTKKLSNNANCRIQATFLDIASRMHEIDSKDEWTDFEKFAHHFLLFAAKHNIDVVTFDSLEKYWRRLYAKFLMYTANQTDEAQILINCLMKNLMRPDGLSIRGVVNADTFFAGFETIINQAIAHHTLQEQLHELCDLSLLSLDAPLALNHNGFKIVSREMELSLDAINPVTKRYNVTDDELLGVLRNQTESSTSLKTILFRYLGMQTLREDLAFYREIFDKFCSNSALEDRILNEILLGFVILITTGNNYKPHLAQDQLNVEFSQFLRQVHGFNSISKEQGMRCVHTFLEHYNSTPRDELKGTTTLWSLCRVGELLHKARKPIPEILTQKFERKKLALFILANQEEIAAVQPWLANNKELAKRLLQAVIREALHQLDKNSIHEKTITELLLIYVYPSINIETLLIDFVKITAFLENYALLLPGESHPIHRAIEVVFKADPQIDTALILTELLAVRVVQEHKQKIELSCELLSAIAACSPILSQIARAKPLLTQVVNFFFSTTTKHKPQILLLPLTERLLELQDEVAIKTMAVILTELLTPSGYNFFNARAYSAIQLAAITQLITEVDCPLSFIDCSLAENTDRDFSDMIAILRDTTPSIRAPLFLIGEFINTQSSMIMNTLVALKVVPFNTLEHLANLIDLKVITPEAALIILGSPSIPQAIATFEQELYATHLERYDLDLELITQKIAEIRYKSEDGEVALDEATQEQLKKDYLTVMSYMLEKPVLIETNEQGVCTYFTINQLSEQQFHTLVESLKSKISLKKQKHGHQLMLLALSCEALYRTNNTFPRYPQILSVLNTLNQTNDIIHEIRTGEGKSIADTLHAVQFCAEKYTVEFSSENEQLALDGLNEFRRFYSYLNVPHGTGIIDSFSGFQDYVIDGINYSTVAKFALFEVQMLLEGKSLPDMRSHICAEIDAILKTTVQFRMSASLNPLLHDTASWEFINKTLLMFIKDKEIFIDNQCSQHDDVANFKNYLLFRNPTDAILKLIDKIPDSLIGKRIESALNVSTLAEGVDFFLMKKGQYYYAAPILDSTNRPDIQVSFTDGGQELLHAALASKLLNFKQEPIGEVIVTISAKNILDQSRLRGGRIMGSTGTGGSNIEIKEFKEQNALHVYSYPAFYPDKRTYLGIKQAIGNKARFLAIAKDIQSHSSDTPCLYFMESPKDVTELKDYLNNNFNHLITNREIQYYLGDKAGRVEMHLIKHAGNLGVITIATKSLARGANFKTHFKDGVVVQNCCVDVTDSDITQMFGRTGRNGTNGQYGSILNTEAWGLESNSPDDIEARFAAHRNNIGLEQQKTRLKTRLLENVRDYVIRHHCFALKKRADRILSRQYGRNSTLIEPQNFLISLRDLNLYIEQHYMMHLGDMDQLPDERVFIDGVITKYQQVLMRWLPDEKFQNFIAVEPLIPLEQVLCLSGLNAVTVDELSIVSGLLSTGWTYLGNQNIHAGSQFLDQLLESFAPYFNQTCGLKHAMAKMVLKREITTTEEIIEKINIIEKKSLEFIDGASTDVINDMFKQIPVIGQHIPVAQIFPIDDIKAYVTAYIATIKEQVQQERWDELALPVVNTKAIGVWYRMFKFAMKAASPIHFIVDRIVIPVLSKMFSALFSRWFAASDNIYIKMMQDMSTFMPNISNALIFIASNLNKNQDNFSVGSYLDVLSPILKNSVFVIMMKELLKRQGKSALLPYLHVIPDFLMLAEQYRDRKLSEILTSDTLMSFFLAACQLDPVKQVLQDTGFEEVVARIPELTPEFLLIFRGFSIQESIAFIKVMGHPETCECLQALPKKTTFKELNGWLNNELEAVPIAAYLPIKQLKNYQENPDRIAAEAMQLLLSLKADFTLTPQKLNTHLACVAASERPTVSASMPLPALEVISASILTTFPWTTVGIVLLISVIVLMNIFFFSIPLLITTIALLASIMAYGYYNHNSVVKPATVLIESVKDTPVGPICVSVKPATNVQPTRQSICENMDASASKGLERFGMFSVPDAKNDVVLAADGCGTGHETEPQNDKTIKYESQASTTSSKFRFSRLI